MTEKKPNIAEIIDKMVAGYPFDGEGLADLCDRHESTFDENEALVIHALVRNGIKKAELNPKDKACYWRILASVAMHQFLYEARRRGTVDKDNIAVPPEVEPGHKVEGVFMVVGRGCQYAFKFLNKEETLGSFRQLGFKREVVESRLDEYDQGA